MNCVRRVHPHFRDRAGDIALWTVGGDRPTFGDLALMATGAQELARAERLRPGDAVLVLALPGPPLFATILGLLGLGVTVVFVEPWLPVREVGHVLGQVRPKIFIGSRLAQLWALRVPAVRKIPRWLTIGTVCRAGVQGRSFESTEVHPDTPGTVTFSSGTTGAPKGLIRSHRCLDSLFEILTDRGHADAFDAPDLCIFPNLALLQLGTGRGAVLFPSGWSRRSMDRAATLVAEARPASMSCGPAFLDSLLRFTERRPRAFDSLRSIAVGGAQVDCEVLERGFERWPDASWTHVYGGAEAEPVAKVDARDSVRRSRARGRFQALYLGRPIPELATNPSPEGLWVSGPNVATPFAFDGESSIRRRDESGREWHFMGDRIAADDGWWFQGRAGQPAEEFELEQRIYADLCTSACFVHRRPDGALFLYGENLAERAGCSDAELAARYPEISGVRRARIRRDRRHRARIDRRGTLAQAGYRDV